MVNKRIIRRRRAAKSNRPIKTDKQPGLSLCEKHFRIFAFGVILISILTQVFDPSLKPASYRGLFITRPFCCLHSWAAVDRAWSAGNHLNYGLGYTKGLYTLAVGNPPPAHPRRYVSHPSLTTLVPVFGMLLFGTEEWQIRLFDLILSIELCKQSANHLTWILGSCLNFVPKIRENRPIFDKF
jgi:hypothetical protein